MLFRDIPDPNVDWDNIRYNKTSDAIRPDKGFRFCKQCGYLYAVNNYNYYKNKQAPDGYSYVCRKCSTKSK